eukprot:3168076-Lingulodinium_polyedra.AAC.1
MAGLPWAHDALADLGLALKYLVGRPVRDVGNAVLRQQVGLGRRRALETLLPLGWARLSVRVLRGAAP